MLSLNAACSIMKNFLTGFSGKLIFWQTISFGTGDFLYRSLLYKMIVNKSKFISMFKATSDTWSLT